MPNFVKEHLYSASVTFISTFLLTLGASLGGITTGDISKDAIISLLVAAVRAAGKVVIESLVPPSSVGVNK